MKPRRPLNEFEARMHAEGRCIVCGQRLDGYRMKDGSMRYPFECAEDRRLGAYNTLRGRGAGANASLGREYRRRTGYSSAAQGAPDRDDDEEEKP